ncbi:MAG: phosphoribosylanthranilate isomerase [Acidobacteriota bacterium]|nr:MAG: phosphoribosylanthranilate isomerase [Acidobacteriota bacterium]
MRVRVKICGVTTAEALDAAVQAGAHAIGFVFADSPRAVTVAQASRLAAGLPPFVASVAVFRRPSRERLAAVLASFPADRVQCDLQDRDRLPAEARERFLPVLRAGPQLDSQLETLLRANEGGQPAALLEGPHSGVGRTIDWDVAARVASRIRLVLAGGLTAENVAEAIRRGRPHAVDVSSGVESARGRKEPELIRAFVAAVRRAEASLSGGTLP